MIALILKATLVLLAGGISAMLLRRRSAALRHLVWTVTLAAAVGLALATPLVPELAVPTPGWQAVAVPLPAVLPVSVEPGITAAEEPATIVSTSAAGASLAGLDVRVAVWIAGSLAVLGWLALGRLGLSLLLHRAEPFHDPDWVADLAQSAAAAGVSAPVGLFISSAIGSPATWGIRRPVIVLPPAARAWSADRRGVVLAHELAHVARGDGVSNLIGWLACALYWTNPLAWMAARRLRAEAERAADDHVLTRGIAPDEYAAHLLDVARGSRAMRLMGASAIGMARPSTLERRLLAVLDETGDRIAPGGLARHATWMTCAGLVLPLASLTPSAAIAPAAQAAQAAPTGATDTTLDASYPARPGEKLTLDLETGGNVEIAGWDEPTVRIRGTLDGMSRRETLVEIRHRPPGIRLHVYQSPKRSFSSTRHRFEIRVPRRYDVHIESGGGDLSIAGVEGSFTGHTGGGALRIDRAKGMAALQTGGGDISVTDSELDGRVSTGGGAVTLRRVSGGIRGHSGSGPVTQVDPGTLHIEKAGGAIDLDRAPNGADVRTGGGQIRIGPSAELVKASTGGGDITLGPVDGSIEAFTGAGTLRATVVSQDASVEFTTGKGSAILTLPRGFTGRFELETAYTRTNPRTRIDSDWNLSETETDEWDSSQGSPRKYVRATGKAGNGPGVIRIRIVNGDITIRRAR